MDTLLHLDHVDRTFWMGEVPVRVLTGVDLRIRDGELLSIVGPSGSGKTTILNLIGGLDQPSSGHVWFRGRDLGAETESGLTQYRRAHVGFVFQFYNLVPNLTARENVMVAAELSDTPLEVDGVLGRVGLSDRGAHFPSQLSGGEQQRVAIARAVVKNPTLLLCDEPTGALDLPTGRTVLRILADLNRELGKTVIIITHNAALSRVADRVVRLGSGTVRAIEANAVPQPPEEIVW
ncbi:MAG: ABC transporter ATP-binding protein [Planctomycetes bacterium]|nr:ABC transporter ATP-binding protein [Planctomycetota bacterium]